MTTKARRGRGQPAFVPTLKQRQNVAVMRGNGETLAAIAHSIGIDAKTLNKHFANELASGQDTVRQAIGGALVRAAIGGNVNAMRYWLSCRGGEQWRVIERRELGGIPDGLPIPVESRVIVYLPDNGRGDRKPDKPE